MARHGTNCGGRWNATLGVAFYTRTPDKEPPLWNPCSPVIYLWTSTERNDEQAYSFSFEGNVWVKKKSSNLGSLGFRAVRSPEPGSSIPTY
jgi:hypothetical protein